MPIYSAKKVQIALLIAKELKIPTKYSDFSDVFLEKKALILLKTIKLNLYVIELQKSQQPLYRSIYSLGLIKLKTLKTYIQTNLANGFIWPSKLSADAFILFIGNPDGNLCLYINYQGFNNLIIKNWYPLPIISKLLDQLGQAKRFI